MASAAQGPSLIWYFLKLTYIDMLTRFPVLMLSQEILATPRMLTHSLVWGPHRGRSRGETLGRADTEI